MLRELLEKYREEPVSEREKGTYFEHLTKVWLEHAPTQRAQFSPVLSFARWAKRFAIETVGDPKFPYLLFCRIITVSLETIRLAKSLSKLEIRGS